MGRKNFKVESRTRKSICLYKNFCKRSVRPITVGFLQFEEILRANLIVEREILIDRRNWKQKQG
uniref:Uncharacterized protein n=1 Tax=Meloidogyne enterolobii TaxID=390850 RepID=A0A6V7XAL1_MELEN|nr:unnamed protein product [Meloidogyne enterolobii]CAD2196215.1 unnamed protein product [Meloidogyne enterolobii]